MMNQVYSCIFNDESCRLTARSLPWIHRTASSSTPGRRSTSTTARPQTRSRRTSPPPWRRTWSAGGVRVDMLSVFVYTCRGLIDLFVVAGGGAARVDVDADFWKLLGGTENDASTLSADSTVWTPPEWTDPTLYSSNFCQQFPPQRDSQGCF